MLTEVNKRSKTDNVSILINSCDKYSDVWQIFFPLFFKYWPDCPWDIYLGSNEKTYNDPRVIPILVGKDNSWAESAYKMVSALPTDNFLFFLDDFLIFWKVDTFKVIHIYKIFQKLNANCIRLRNSPVINNTVHGFSEIVERPKGESNRIALDVAFWKRDFFIKMLKFGENPWQMEINGSIRSNKYNGIYSTKEWIIIRRNGLEGGKWMRYNLKLLEKEGLSIPHGHKIRSRLEEFIVKINFLLYKVWLYRKIRQIKTKISKKLKQVLKVID